MLKLRNQKMGSISSWRPVRAAAVGNGPLLNRPGSRGTKWLSFALLLASGLFAFSMLRQCNARASRVHVEPDPSSLIGDPSWITVEQQGELAIKYRGRSQSELGNALRTNTELFNRLVSETLSLRRPEVATKSISISRATNPDSTAETGLGPAFLSFTFDDMDRPVILDASRDTAIWNLAAEIAWMQMQLIDSSKGDIAHNKHDRMTPK